MHYTKSSEFWMCLISALFIGWTFSPVSTHPYPPCDASALSGGAQLLVEFNPPELIVTEGATTSINATISGIVGNITISISSADAKSVDILFNKSQSLLEPIDGNLTIAIPIRGRSLSVGELQLNITHTYEAEADDAILSADDIIASSGDGGKDEVMNVNAYVENTVFSYVVKVNRRMGYMEKVFTYTLLIWLIISYVTMGSKIDLVIIREKVRRPFGVLTGIACQFVIMPFIAYVLAQAPGVTPEAAVGLLVIGSCPGGWISNVFALLMDVDFALSITMTLFSSFMALFMMPLNMFIYGSRITAAAGTSATGGLKTPYKDIAMQLGLMLVPVTFGIYITQKSDKVANILLKCLKPVSLLSVILVLTIGIPSQVYIFNASWRVYAICLALPFCGGLLGFGISKLLRRSNKEALTISFETGVQNSLLAITVAKLSYPQPEADLVARMPALVSILQSTEGVVMIVTYVAVRRLLVRMGKIARPDTGDYRQCDVDAEAIHCEIDAGKNDDSGDQVEIDKRALNRVIHDDAGVKVKDNKNRYLKMHEDDDFGNRDNDYNISDTFVGKPTEEFDHDNNDAEKRNDVEKRRIETVNTILSDDPDIDDGVGDDAFEDANDRKEWECEKQEYEEGGSHSNQKENTNNNSVAATTEVKANDELKALTHQTDIDEGDQNVRVVQKETFM